MRFNAAKGVARIAARLPEDMRVQILEAVLALLTEHVNLNDIPVPALVSDTPSSFRMEHVAELDELDVYAVSESTWHGIFLALAECMRRVLIPPSLLCRTLYWVHRGLLFDVRRGTGAMGSNVRDACCYVLWALARIRQLDVLSPFTPSVAQRLLLVAALDRDVTIRRAASAAFQEWVGRTSQVPHGISLLKDIDFSAVGIRRNAYTVCAPRIAEYTEYRAPILAHIQRVCLPHWDLDVRMLAAAAVRHIVRRDAESAAGVLDVQFIAAGAMEPNRVHGALLALAAVCKEINDAKQVHRALHAALHVSPRLFATPGGALVLEAACRVVAATAPKAQGASLALLQTAASRPESGVHQALADAVRALADSTVVRDFTSRLLRGWSSCTADERRSGALALGKAGTWAASERCVLLCGAVQGEGGVDVETRRNAAASLPALACNVPDKELILFALMQGLQDHTTDQRGDVGSWVRTQCLVSLPSILPLVSASHVSVVCTAIAAHLAERIDSVRCTACCVLRDLALRYPVPAATSVRAALDAPDAVFRDARTAFSRVVPLLAEPVYRSALLPMLTRTIAGRSESAVRVQLMQLRDAGRALVDWMQRADAAVINAVYAALGTYAARTLRENRAFVPCLRTTQHLLEFGVVPTESTRCVHL